MTALRTSLVMTAAFLLPALWSDHAQALCIFDTVGVTVTPLAANTGTYVAPTAPTAQAVSITITGTYTKLSSSGGACSGALSFQRGSLPATMARTGGAATLPYSISTAATGGTSLIFAGTFTLGSALPFTVQATGPLGSNPYSVTLTVYVLMQPNSPQTGGSYSDSLTMVLYDTGTSTAFASRGFTVTGTVISYCTIGGLNHPSADTATIPVSTAGAVNTAVINKSYPSVACSSPSNVQITSQNGAVTNAGTASAGFTNVIDYSSTAVFSGASASLNTATNPLARGPESGAAVSTTGTAPTGTMTVTITPQANVLPLISGTYSDTLTITITPQ